MTDLVFILSIAITWAFVKVVKTIIFWSKEKSLSLKALFYDGGMPSAHTTAVTAAATSIYIEAGLSVLFVLSFILAVIVMNDAMKVRWVTGEQSKVINHLMKGKKGFKKLEERIGHTPEEVFVGLIIGILGPILIYAIA